MPELFLPLSLSQSAKSWRTFAWCEKCFSVIFRVVCSELDVKLLPWYSLQGVEGESMLCVVYF